MILELLLIAVLCAIFGAIFGSFANVVAIRTHENSTLWGRSHCVHCNVPLKIQHLVPIISWIIQGGKCTQCHKAIHIQYPLVEVGAALLAVVSVFRHLPFETGWPAMAFEFFFGLCLIIFLVMDARWKELPLELMVATGVIFSLWDMLMAVGAGATPWSVAWSHLVGFGILTLFFLFQWVVSRKRWIGVGDIWLGAVLGAVLGWPLAGIAIYLSYIFGGSVAITLLVSKKVKPGARIPFAPSLVAGTLAAMWWGPAILNWLSNALS